MIALLDKQYLSVVFFQLTLNHNVLVRVAAGTGHADALHRIVADRQLLLDDRRQRQRVVRIEVFLLDRSDR